MAEQIVDHGSLLVALCLPEIWQAQFSESWWDDRIPGTDPLPLPEPDSSDYGILGNWLLRAYRNAAPTSTPQKF
jgi:hypothetical protein